MRLMVPKISHRRVLYIDALHIHFSQLGEQSDDCDHKVSL